MKKSGLFLVIEGAHGSGKTLLARRLKKKLEDSGLSVWKSKEPYSSDLSRIITKFSKSKYTNPLALQHLILADRAIHINQISKKLEQYDIVISVRYILSNIVYQSMQKIPEKKIIQLNSNFPNPDMMLILTRNIKKRYVQMRKDSKSRKQSFFLTNNAIELEEKHYHKLSLKLKKKKTIKIIDADKPKNQFVDDAYGFVVKNNR